MKGPSPHLSWDELACNDGTPYPEKWRASRAIWIGQEFEIIRARLGGKPIRINSAYRHAAYNRSVKGARNSQHVQGTALDVSPIHCTLKQLREAIHARSHEQDSRINGVGFYPSFVHFDVRAYNGRIVVWQGSRSWAEVRA